MEGRLQRPVGREWVVVDQRRRLVDHLMSGHGSSFSPHPTYPGRGSLTASAFHTAVEIKKKAKATMKTGPTLTIVSSPIRSASAVPKRAPNGRVPQAMARAVAVTP